MHQTSCINIHSERFFFKLVPIFFLIHIKFVNLDHVYSTRLNTIIYGWVDNSLHLRKKKMVVKGNHLIAALGTKQKIENSNEVKWLDTIDIILVLDLHDHFSVH